MTNSLCTDGEVSKYSKKFWIMIAIFYSLFVIRNVVGISFPVVIYLIWVAVMALCFDEHEIKALIVCLIPLVPALQYKYATYICTFILIAKFYRQFRVKNIIIPGVLLMAWEMLHFFVGDFSFTEYIRNFSELLCIMVIVCILPRKRPDIGQLSRVLALSATISFLILLITTLNTLDKGLFEFLQSGFRLGSETESELEFHFVYNANGLGYLCNLVIVALGLNFHFKRANILDAIMLCFMVFIGFMSVSRTFLICLAITLVAFVVLQTSSFIKQVKRIFVIAVTMCVALFVINSLLPDLIANYITRFDVDDITNGRDYLMNFYNEFIFASADRYLFGIGMQDIAGKVYILEKEIVLVPHNGYQQLVVAWGIPGFLLMLILMFGIFAKPKKNGKIEIILYLPLLILLINIMAGQFFTVSFKMLSLIYMYELINSGVIDKSEMKIDEQ